MKKNRTIFLSGFILFFALSNFSYLYAQDDKNTEDYHIQVKYEYQGSFWTPEFSDFITQHATHIYDRSENESVGWEIGVPIYRFKLIGKQTYALGSNLRVNNTAIALRYSIYPNKEFDIFSFDLGFGFQNYTFSYYNQVATGSVTIDDFNSILNVPSNSFDITQELWHINVGVNYDLKISHQFYMSLGIEYRFLMGAKTSIGATHQPVDDFPIMSRHSLVSYLGISYHL